jgi:hypothetical protein
MQCRGFGLAIEEVTGGCKKLHNKEFNSLYFSPKYK